MTIAQPLVADVRFESTSEGSPQSGSDRPLRRGTSGRRDQPPGRVPRRGLAPPALLDVAERFAAGLHTSETPDDRFSNERTYELMSLDSDSEVWLIHWPIGGELQLHDHGGSAGAFWVVRGCLEESYVHRGRLFDTLGRRHHRASSGVGFESRYIHDIRNGGGEVATSVHAYSPPLHSMTYYRRDHHELAAERTEYRSSAAWEL